MSSSSCVLVLISSLLWASQNVPLTQAFSVLPTTRHQQQHVAGSPTLWMSAEEEGESLEEPVVAAAGEEAEEEPQEDPELTALKEEIARLETTLKDKRRTLAGTSDKADDYTKTGYARKVAEMENMRRARSMLASSNKQGSIASTLTQFLPIYDRLQELNQENQNDDFGKQYGALYTSMKQAFADLGVEEYSVQVGSNVDNFRMSVLDSHHDDTQAADTVLECLAGGLELQGNIVRPAQVVASLGPEAPPEEEAPESDEDASEGEPAPESNDGAAP